MFNREHSQITYEDLRRFLEHIRLEYRRYVIDKTSDHGRTIIDIGDLAKEINIGDVITLDKNHKYSLATQSALKQESPLMVVINKLSNNQVEVLSHGAVPVVMPQFENKSILYLDNFGHLTTTKPDNRVTFAIGLYADQLLIVYPRNIASKENAGGGHGSYPGLDNVDNTSDLDKPISNATRAEFNNVMNTIRALDEALKRKLEDHISNQDVHIRKEDRVKWDGLDQRMTNHIENEIVHTSNAERVRWNNMTPNEKFLEHINNKTIHPAIGGYDQLDLRYAKHDEVPTKLSQLNNDANYITREDIPELNLGEYVKKHDLEEYIKIKDVDNKLSNYQTKLNLSAFIRKIDLIPHDYNDIVYSHTDKKIILIGVDDHTKYLSLFKKYPPDGNSYYLKPNGSSYVVVFPSFNVLPNNGLIFNNMNEYIPMNSVTVIDHKLTENGIETGTFGLLYKDKYGIYFIDGEIPPKIDLATETKPGIVQPDNITIRIDSQGIITSQAIPATTNRIGSVKPDDDTIGIHEDGTVYLKHSTVDKLSQLTDVDASHIDEKVGYALCVKDDGLGFEFRRPANIQNYHIEKTINSSSYEFIYDFSQHINKAISATIDIGNIDNDHPAKIKFVGKNNGELIEEFIKAYHMTIPEREFYVSIYISGHVKLSIDIVSLT